MSALDQIIGTIPVVVGGHVLMSFTERMSPKETKRKKAKRRNVRGLPTGTGMPTGRGDFSNLF